MTKVRDVYQAIVVLSKDGICDANQRDIIKLANISRRHLQRILHELEDLGLIQTARAYHFRQRKTKNSYIILGRPDSRSPVAHWTDGTSGVPSQKTDGTSGVPSGGAMGHEESHRGAMGLPESHHDHDGDADGNKTIKNEILNYLDFLNEPNRSFCAGKLSLEQARNWRQFKDFYDNNELWPRLGLTVNPVGWIVRRIQAGDEPPPIQIPLPEGSIDMSDFTSRGMTKEEIQHQHPLGRQGAAMGDDGFWR